MHRKKEIKQKKKSAQRNKSLSIKKEFNDIHLRDDVFLKSSFSIFEVSIITLIAIMFGIIIGFLIDHSKSASFNKNINNIVNTYEKIMNNYYGEVNEEKLSNAAINGMINSLEDPYSNYLEGDVAEDFNQMIDGKYVGIGVVVNYTEEGTVISKITKNSPSEKAGLEVGDIIIKVENIDVESISGEKLISLIRGKEGTKVQITVKRGNETLNFEIKRTSINIDTVSKDIFVSGNVNVGYIKIDVFAANTASQFNAALVGLEDEKIDSLIIDVRNNPGGHLLQTRKILSNFFDKKTVLYQIESKKSKKKVYSISKEKRNYPIAVLINESSASAAEVLASCFKENYDNAIVVGEKSYGKGTIQQSEKISDNTSIKYTTDKWLTSKGKSLDKIGVKPDYEVINNSSNFDFESDIQLQTALSNIAVSKNTDI